MKKFFFRFFYFLGNLFNFRRLKLSAGFLLLSGTVAATSSCSGESKTKTVKENQIDTAVIHCYTGPPVADSTEIDSAANENLNQ